MVSTANNNNNGGEKQSLVQKQGLVIKPHILTIVIKLMPLRETYR